MKAPAGQGNETVHVVERDCVTQAPYCIEQVVEKPAPGTSDKKAGAEGTEYREALYAKMTGLLKEPATPMIAPPVALRGLIMPYRGDGNRLYQQRYVYFFVDGPRWILNEITEDEE
jgi:conjugal transfer pilus assembly protein TraV